MKMEKRLATIALGLSESFSKTVAESDVMLFAGITGDFSPVHLDEPFAAQTRFKTRIVHGGMLVGFISTVMARINAHLPPPGGVSCRYDVRFVAPVMFGDTITTTLTVREKIIARNEIVLDARCVNQNDQPVLKGRTFMKVLKD